VPKRTSIATCERENRFHRENRLMRDGSRFPSIPLPCLSLHFADAIVCPSARRFPALSRTRHLFARSCTFRSIRRFCDIKFRVPIRGRNRRLASVLVISLSAGEIFIEHERNVLSWHRAVGKSPETSARNFPDRWEIAGRSLGRAASRTITDGRTLEGASYPRRSIFC